MMNFQLYTKIKGQEVILMDNMSKQETIWYLMEKREQTREEIDLFMKVFETTSDTILCQKERLRVRS